MRGRRSTLFLTANRLISLAIAIRLYSCGNLETMTESLLVDNGCKDLQRNFGHWPLTLAAAGTRRTIGWECLGTQREHEFKSIS